MFRQKYHRFDSCGLVTTFRGYILIELNESIKGRKKEKFDPSIVLILGHFLSRFFEERSVGDFLLQIEKYLYKIGQGKNEKFDLSC